MNPSSLRTCLKSLSSLCSKILNRFLAIAARKLFRRFLKREKRMKNLSKHILFFLGLMMFTTYCNAQEQPLLEKVQMRLLLNTVGLGIFPIRGVVEGECVDFEKEVNYMRLTFTDPETTQQYVFQSNSSSGTFFISTSELNNLERREAVSFTVLGNTFYINLYSQLGFPQAATIIGNFKNKKKDLMFLLGSQGGLDRTIPVGAYDLKLEGSNYQSSPFQPPVITLLLTLNGKVFVNPI